MKGADSPSDTKGTMQKQVKDRVILRKKDKTL